MEVSFQTGGGELGMRKKGYYQAEWIKESLTGDDIWTQVWDLAASM